MEEIQNMEKVRPVDLPVYEASLREVKGYTFPGYVDQVIDLLKVEKPKLNQDQVYSVRRGNTRNWLILEAIRKVCGLEPTKRGNTPNREKVVADLKLHQNV